MPLVRAWMRGLSGASLAAVLVPGGIFAALLLLAVAGSFGRLGGLGQALSGPPAPSFNHVTAAVQGAAGQGPALLPVASASATGIAPGGVASGAGPKPTRVATGSPAPHGGSPSGGGGTQPTGPGTPGVPNGPGSCGSCGQPPPRQTLIDQVVTLGTSITSKIPGPVGQLTTQLLKQLGATVDRILPADRRAGVVSQVGSSLSQLKLP